MRNRILLFTGILGIALYRFWVLAQGNIPIDLEEAYYLSWSDNLDWGYFSKPPMIAALLGLHSTLFGESAFAIKSLSIVLHSASAFFIYLLAARLYDKNTAFWAAIAFQTLPIVGLVSLFSTTDAPLIFFWASTLWSFHHALEKDQWRWWLLTGLLAGLGMLSKYTMGALAVGFLLYLLFEKRQAIMLSAKFWLGLVLAFVVLLPNLYWQTQHNFITFSHTKHIAGAQQTGGGWEPLMEFVLSQAGVFGPIFFLALAMWLWRRNIWQSSANRYLLLASLPLLLIICIQAYRFEANINWASPAYIGLTIVSVYYLYHCMRFVFWFSLLLNTLLVSTLYHYHAITGWLGIELGKSNDPYYKRLGWQELGQQFKAIRQQHPDAALLSSDRKLLALMAYHSRDKSGRPMIYTWNPDQQWDHQYDIKHDLIQQPKGEFFWLSGQPLNTGVLSRFTGCTAQTPLFVSVYPDLERKVHLYLCRDFQGYP